MKVFLGNTPWKKAGFYGVRAGSRWPHFERDGAGYMPFPFFLAYGAAVLEKDQQEVLLVDGIGARMSTEEFLSKIVKFKPDLAVLEVATSSFNVDMAMAKMIKSSLPNCQIAFCGMHVFMYEPEFLKTTPEVDYVFQGEFEYTLRELVQRLDTKKDLEGCLGMIYRKNGEVINNGKRPLIANIDELPMPARHFTNLCWYHDNPGGIPDVSLQMHASRGCPFQCVFCAWPQIMYGDHSYRVRNPVAILDEIEHCVKEYKVKSIYFDDDTFNIGKPRLVKLAEEFKKRKLNIPWGAMSRADTCDFDTMAKLRDVGMVAVKYGVESGDQGIITDSGKHLNLDTLRKACKKTKELDIKIHLTFTFGLPGETYETARKTIDLAMELDPDTLQFSIATPYPGSKFYELLEKEGKLVSKNWDEYDGYNQAVTKTNELGPQDLVNIHREAERKWARHRVKRIIKKNNFVSLVKKSIHDPVKATHRLKDLVTLGRY